MCVVEGGRIEQAPASVPSHKVEVVGSFSQDKDHLDRESAGRERQLWSQQVQWETEICRVGRRGAGKEAGETKPHVGCHSHQRERVPGRRLWSSRSNRGSPDL